MLSLNFQILSKYNNRTKIKSLVIVNDASTTFKWEPSTSLQFTGTSVTGTLYYLAIINNSTSNAHLSKC